MADTESSLVGAGPGRDVYDDGASGWLTFAGVMILVVGTLNIVYGIAAIDDANFYVNDARFIFSDLNTYGWIALGIGVIEVLVGLGVFARVQFARWAGVVIVSVNAIAQLLFIAAYPLAALAILAIDVLVIYGLVAHGGKQPAL